MEGWTDDPGKNNMSPNPEVGKHNNKNIDRTSVKLMSHLRRMTKLTKWKSDKN